MSAAAVTEAGTLVWDGKALVGSHPGIASASDVGGAVAFEVSNGGFEFRSSRPAGLGHLAAARQ